MGDGDDSASVSKAFERRLDHPFRFGVECRGRFIEQQNRGVLEQGARNGQTLLLTA